MGCTAQMNPNTSNSAWNLNSILHLRASHRHQKNPFTESETLNCSPITHLIYCFFLNQSIYLCCLLPYILFHNRMRHERNKNKLAFDDPRIGFHKELTNSQAKPAFVYLWMRFEKCGDHAPNSAFTHKNTIDSWKSMSFTMDPKMYARMQWVNDLSDLNKDKYRISTSHPFAH